MASSAEREDQEVALIAADNLRARSRRLAEQRETAARAAEERAQAELEAIVREARAANERVAARHPATCDRRPCHDCQRAVCARCGAAVHYDDLRPEDFTRAWAGDVARVACATCRPVVDRVELLAAGRASMPKGAEYRSIRFGSLELGGRILKGAGGEAIARAKEFVDAKHVTFSGPARVGKTTLLACMLHEVIDRGLRLDAPADVVERARRAFWVDPDELASARAQSPLGAGGDPPVIARAKAASVLVIDDLGAELASRNQDGVREVIRKRFADGLPTWVSVGIPWAAIAAAYGGGIARRVSVDAKIIALGRIAEGS